MSTLNSKQNSAMKIKKIACAAVFAALAYVAMYATSWIKVSFLTFDAKDAIIALSGLIFGPIYSFTISLLVALIEFITVSDTGWYGFIMNFLSSAVFSTVCALIYKYKKNIKGAVISLIAAIFSVTAVMMLLNIIITPFYMHVERDAVLSMIPTLLLPFNLTKATLNSALVLILYKPISNALKSAKVLPSNPLSQNANNSLTAEEKKKKKLIFSLIVTGVGIVVAALCVVVFLVFLGGNAGFGG